MRWGSLGVALAALCGACGFEARTGGTDGSVVDPDATGAPPPADADPDAKLFLDAALLLCPLNYTVALPSSSSRYRVITTNAVFASQHASCNQDAPGGVTHLMSPESLTELDELFAVLQTVTPQPTMSGFYLGIVQQKAAATTAADWLVFSGPALPPGRWAASQPNDLDSFESDHDEQRALIDVEGTLQDVSGSNGFGAVCECDGTPVAAPVEAALAP